MHKKIIFGVIIILILAGIVMAVSWTPTGDIDLKNFYKIINATTISAHNYCNQTNCYNISDFLKDTWSLNYTNYYDKNQTDNNISLRYLATNPNNFINSTNLTNVAFINKSNNFNQNNLTNISIIKMTENNFACSLNINHTICSNATGTYIIG